MEADKFLDLAAQTAAQVNPHHTKSNPRVGCVIASQNQVISVGAHAKYGEDHAEIIALQNLIPGWNRKNKLAHPGMGLRGTTVYLTLEPCVNTPHKKTPACTSALIQHKPASVVIGALDPHFPGQGVAQLSAAGIEVKVLNTHHHKQLNPWFEPWITQNRPFVTLKIAQSLDGKITPPPTLYQQGHRALTGRKAQTVVHNWRAHHQAVLTSTTTVLEDDPLFDVRKAGGLAFNPTAPDLIIVGTKTIPQTARLYGVPNRNVYFIEPLSDLVPLCQTKAIASVMSECGGQLNTALVETGLVDQIEVFTAPIFCGETAKPSFIKAVNLQKFTALKSTSRGSDVQLTLRLN